MTNCENFEELYFENSSTKLSSCDGYIGLNFSKVYIKCHVKGKSLRHDQIPVVSVKPVGWPSYAKMALSSAEVIMITKCQVAACTQSDASTDKNNHRTSAEERVKMEGVPVGNFHHNDAWCIYIRHTSIIMKLIFLSILRNISKNHLSQIHFGHLSFPLFMSYQTKGKLNKQWIL